MWERARSAGHDQPTCRRSGPAREGRPLDRLLPGAVRRRGHAGAGARPLPIGEIHGRGPGSVGPLPPLRAVHAVHRDRQRDRAARDLAAALPRRRRAPDRGPADRPRPRARGRCWRWRRSSSGRCRGPTGEPVRSSRPRAPRASASAPPRGAPRRRCRGARSSAPRSSSASSQVANAAGPISSSTSFSVRRTTGVGMRRSGAGGETSAARSRRSPGR